MNTTALDPRTFTLPAKDGYPLQAIHYPAMGVRKGQLIVAGATGVKQLFYSRFARFGRLAFALV